MSKVEIIECPRDAMQGIQRWIPTRQKIRYVKTLLNVGFNYLDVGSFVSPKAIPQMRDTVSVLNALDRGNSATQLLCIVANLRGAEAACIHPAVDVLGYPFSISENFQMRNTHKTISESEQLLNHIIDRCIQHQKELVVYLSMGFGNPYGDPWSPDILAQWVSVLAQKGIQTISLSDTVGTASSSTIQRVFESILPAFPHLKVGAHLHVTPEKAIDKVTAAYRGGCRRFDTAIQGFGGCPMAKDELVGNLPTEKLLTFLHTENIPHALNSLALESAVNRCREILGSAPAER